MSYKIELIKELKKVMEFYQELGFENLPIKVADAMGSIQAVQTSQSVIARSPEKVVTTKQSNYSEIASLPARRNDKGEALRKLREKIGDCQLCKLSKERKNIVFGEGNPDAELMFIGEGPGREEDLHARPFVGDAGKVLTNLIKKMGLRREDVYIANIVKCRPPFNREPGDDEITTCSPFVEKQIGIIEPKVIIGLGKIAAQTLTGSKIPISKLRGKFCSYKDIPVMPTFHPAYLLRNPKDKWLTWEDAQKVIEKLKCSRNL